MISAEALRERLAHLHRERETLVANLNAYNGAIEECEYWLRQLEPAEATGPRPVVSSPAKEI